MASKNDDIQG